MQLANPATEIARFLDALDPPMKMSVSQAATQYLQLDDPGGYTGPWRAEETPYLIEPMDKLASRQHESVCFVGPARCGKTAGLLLGWMAHIIINDPGPLMVVHMTQDKAEQFSKVDVHNTLNASPELRDRLSPRAHHNGIRMRLLRNGMVMVFGHPAASHMAGSTYRYVMLTDYDRYPDKAGKGGNVYGLALKRTQTLMSRGKLLVESSPEHDIVDPNWRPASRHEAPPTGGIMGIYNRSDRHRWYWQCLDCREWFEAAPGLALFSLLPPEDELLEIVRGADLGKMATDTAKVVCPHCSSIIGPEHKSALNKSGKWVADGHTINQDGSIDGGKPSASIAGYWLGGVAAAYQTWTSIVHRYLMALRQYALAGDEGELRNTCNVDQGAPYMPRHLVEMARSDGALAEDLPRYVVPDQARFVIAAVDVQGGTKGRFVVQVYAIGPGMEQWIIDRYSITDSPRGEGIQIDPAGYPEDWDALTSRVINATYRTSGEYELRTLLTVIDSGGEAGVTANAYAWYRRIAQAGQQSKVMLVKGASTASDSPIRKANARDVRGKPLRDVPLVMVNTNFFKDTVASYRRRKAPGPGYMHYPEWLPDSFYDELAAETRDKSGKWKKVRARNEALDLWVYVLAGCWKLGAHKLKWDKPPPWAMPADENSQRVTADERREEQAGRQAKPPESKPSSIVSDFDAMPNINITNDSWT